MTSNHTFSSSLFPSSINPNALPSVIPSVAPSTERSAVPSTSLSALPSAKPSEMLSDIVQNIIQYLRKRNFDDTCNVRYTLPLQIEYDSTYCNARVNGGKADKAISSIENIINEVNKIYDENDLCLTIQPTINGYCDEETDVYLDIVKEKDPQNRLDKFRTYMNNEHPNRIQSGSDRWLPGHLFTADAMETTNVGRAFIVGPCKPRFFHAVNSFVNVPGLNDYSPNQPGAYSLMAHELGHNLGADHLNKIDYLMFEHVCQDCRCFHPDSVQILRTNMSQVCEESRKNVLQIEMKPLDVISFGFGIVALGAVMVLLLMGWIINKYRKKRQEE